jgi:hypothetical protein
MADSCEYDNESSGSLKFWKFLTGCGTNCFSRRNLLHGIWLLVFSLIYVSTDITVIIFRVKISVMNF